MTETKTLTGPIASSRACRGRDWVDEYYADRASAWAAYSAKMAEGTRWYGQPYPQYINGPMAPVAYLVTDEGPRR